MTSHLEEELVGWFKYAGVTGYTRQFRAIPGRRYSFDFAFIAARILVEVQGGVWSRGKSGHKSGRGIEDDTEKLNLAVIEGYRVLQVTGKQIKDGRAVNWILEALKGCQNGQE